MGDILYRLYWKVSGELTFKQRPKKAKEMDIQVSRERARHKEYSKKDSL